MLGIVREILKKRLGDEDPPRTGETGFVLAQPEVAGRGHVATNAAFVLAGKENKLPQGSAAELKKYLEDEAPKGFFENIEIAEPGFLNIWFSKDAIRSEFKKIAEAGDRWGAINEKGKVIIEYSQPNIAKPMHIGHLRSTIIGDALANIFEFAGYKVVRWNYLGDWGTQFGKLIVAYKRWGDDKKIEQDSVNELNNLYVKFHEEVEHNPSLDDEAREEFKKLEDGNKENRELWERFKKESVREFEDVYGVLGIKFDEWIGEAFYEKDLNPLIERLESDGLATESEGALVVDLENEGLPPGLIRKSDGATLYLTRDIANLEYRIKKYKPDTILYVVDNGQSLHFQQLFAIAEMVGLKIDAHHVKFGLVLSEDLKRLSTRAGRHISLTGVVEEAIKRARKIADEKQPELSAKERGTQQAGKRYLPSPHRSRQSERLSVPFLLQARRSFEGYPSHMPQAPYPLCRIRSRPESLPA